MKQLMTLLYSSNFNIAGAATGLLMIVLALSLTATPSAMADPLELDFEPSDIRLATYNLGLAPLDVDYAELRSSVVVDQLAHTTQTLEVDVLCVQEVWSDADWLALVDATSGQLSETIRISAEPVAGRCGVDELSPLLACVDEFCPGSSGNALAACAVGRCGAELASVSPNCANCLIDAVGETSDTSHLGVTCLDESSRLAQVSGYLYDGAYDIGLLTSTDVLTSDTLQLDSYLVRSAAIYARIDAPIGEIDVFCTHLASDIPEMPYRGAFESWEAEQAQQIDQILTFIDEHSSAARPIVLLGDLNTGPMIDRSHIPDRGGADGDRIEGVWTDNYDALVASGLRNPYTVQNDPACTQCPSSTFSSDAAVPTLIDHILVANVSGALHTDRIMTDVIEIEADGILIKTHPSDHFGLVLSIGATTPSN